MNEYVTDDRLTIDTVMQYALKTKLMFICVGDDGQEYFHLTQDQATEAILKGVNEGYFKIHLELGEFYYHHTDKALTLLDSKHDEEHCSNSNCCGGIS